MLAGIVGRFAHGRIMDLACGTAYWLPHYAPNCARITLFDQSDRMLTEGRAKAHSLGIVNRCDFVQGDFFEHEFEQAAYDTALVGFFLSHLTEAQERLLFDALRTMLDASGRFLILDSAWSSERSKFNAKVERQPRRLNDGTRSRSTSDTVTEMTSHIGRGRTDVKLDIEHFGPAFYAVSGTFNGT